MCLGCREGRVGKMDKEVRITLQEAGTIAVFNVKEENIQKSQPKQRHQVAYIRMYVPFKPY